MAMFKYLKIVTLFLAALVVLAGCDFGKSPNMDQVRDTLMAEYGDQVFTEEELYGEYGEYGEEGEEGAEGGDGIFEFGPECLDEVCQEGFENYLLLWYEDPIAECDNPCRIIEYASYMDMKAIFDEQQE